MTKREHRIDSIRLIHSTTELRRALAIAHRLREEEHDRRTAAILEAALLADYRRPFIGLAEMSAPLTLEGLGEFGKDEHTLHDRLMTLAGTRASQRRDAQDEPFFKVEVPLDGLALDDVATLINKLRKAVTGQLYPGAADNPEMMRLLVGPLGRDPK